MTITSRTVGSPHVRNVALALCLGAIVVLTQARAIGDAAAFALSAVAAAAAIRLSRQKLGITSEGMVDRRLFHDRRIPWLQVQDFYLGRPRVAPGLCVWVADIHGFEYPLRCTWRMTLRRDYLAAETLIRQLRDHVALARAEGIAAMPTMHRAVPAIPSRLAPARALTASVTTPGVRIKPALATVSATASVPSEKVALADEPTMLIELLQPVAADRRSGVATAELVRSGASRDTRAPIKNGTRRR
jgi:hypothetical protein